MKTPVKVLIVDDEKPIRRFLRNTFEDHGYDSIEAESLAQARVQAVNAHPDVVILDLALPDGDGADFIAWFRGWSPAPIVVLSARGDEAGKVAALDAGADDYLTKPFGVDELLARMRVALRNMARRDADTPDAVFRLRDLEVDLEHRLVSKGGAPVELTPLEYRLLLTLVRNAGKVLTHRYILNEVWGPGNSGDSRYVRVFVAALRKKIETNPVRPELLRTEQGVGYRLMIDDEN